MRHAVFVKPGKVEWREAPDPVLQGDGEAIVRPLVVGRCDLDVAFLRGDLPMPVGAAIGHEMIGEIVALSFGTAPFRLGQRVLVSAQISCGECAPCRRGHTGRCARVPFAASYGMGREGGFGGCLADLVRIPFATAMLTPLPAGVNPVSLIGAADMAADAWRAVGPALAARPGGRLLVIGGAPRLIGLFAAGLGVALGARQVDYSDANPQARELAATYGASAVHPDSSLRGPYDVIVVANPTRAALERAFAEVAPAGHITSVAPTLDGAPRLDTPQLYHRGVSWTIARPDCRSAQNGCLEAWAKLGFRPHMIPAEHVPWDDAPEAWSSEALYVVAVRQ